MFSSIHRYWQKPLIYFLTLTILALATPLAFAPYYQFWLMPILFGGLVILTEVKPHRQISSAYWFGLVGYTAQFWWIHTALHDVSGLPNIYAIPLTFLLPAFLALFPAIAFWLYSKHHLPRMLALGLMLPALWTVTEFARERVFTGFGWGALGYSQIADFSPLAAFAPIGGIHLVTLVTVTLSCWLVLVVKNRSLIQRILFIVAIGLVWNKAREWRPLEYTTRDQNPVSVALLQGNIPQGIKFDEQFLKVSYQRYFEQLSQTKAKIVLLPETAFPDLLQNTPIEIVQKFAEQAKANGNALAVGIPAETADGKGYLNAMINLSNYTQEPDKMQVYAKNHLVPFGEFRPLPQYTAKLYQYMNMPLSDLKRGGIGQEPFNMNGVQMALNICYEDGFGDELIASAKKATVLANASNMAWYGKSNAMWQQLQQSQARALELGRYMIRATNTGVSAIVSPRGQVVKFAQPNTATVLESEVVEMYGQTPYMRMGSSWPIFYGLLFLIGLLFCYPAKWLASLKGETQAVESKSVTPVTPVESTQVIDSQDIPEPVYANINPPAPQDFEQSAVQSKERLQQLLTESQTAEDISAPSNDKHDEDDVSTENNVAETESISVNQVVNTKPIRQSQTHKHKNNKKKKKRKNRK